MSESAHIKSQLEQAAKVGPKASASEAASVVATWSEVSNTAASQDLRAAASIRRRELEYALAKGDAGAREVALAGLDSLASQGW